MWFSVNTGQFLKGWYVSNIWIQSMLCLDIDYVSLGNNTRITETFAKYRLDINEMCFDVNRGFL